MYRDRWRNAGGVASERSEPGTENLNIDRTVTAVETDGCSGGRRGGG